MALRRSWVGGGVRRSGPAVRLAHLLGGPFLGGHEAHRDGVLTVGGTCLANWPDVHGVYPNGGVVARIEGTLRAGKHAGRRVTCQPRLAKASRGQASPQTTAEQPNSPRDADGDGPSEKSGGRKRYEVVRSGGDNGEPDFRCTLTRWHSSTSDSHLASAPSPIPVGTSSRLGTLCCTAQYDDTIVGSVGIQCQRRDGGVLGGGRHRPALS